MSDKDLQKHSPPTIHDVARSAGVSIGTVSRVINRRGRGRGDTELRVHEAIATLGYRVNAVARSMRTQSTRTVALLVHDIANPIFAATARAAQAVFEEADYFLMLASAGVGSGREAPIIRLLNERRMEGVIAFLRREDDPDMIEALSDFGGAVVVIDRAIDLDADVVMTDHAGGVMRATQYLIDLGHRSIALIAGATSIHPGRERVRGFVEAFQSYGLQPPLHLIRDQSLDAAYGFREASGLLFERPSAPTAIIAAGNQLLEGALGAIRAAKLDIPRQISLIGFDDSSVARLATPSVTVISRDIDQMGTIAAQMLLDRVRLGPRHPLQKVMLPTEIVLRNSCGPNPNPVGQSAKG
jgi:LacI family transcriptional regulator